MFSVLLLKNLEYYSDLLMHRLLGKKQCFVSNSVTSSAEQRVQNNPLFFPKRLCTYVIKIVSLM